MSTPETPTVTRYVGACQICEATHKLTTARLSTGDADGQVLVHHGYQRPGWGSIVGGCPGVGESPFELSCEATKRYRAVVGHALADTAARLDDLRGGRVIELLVPSPMRGSLPRTIVAADADFALHVRYATYGCEARVQQLTREAARLDALIGRWVLAPLRTVEEDAAPKADAKAAAKAARAAAYQSRTAAKIDGYRRRLAVAVRNRTTSTIADIFESAPRQLGDRGLTAAEAFAAIGSAEVFAAFGLDPAAGTGIHSTNGRILGAMRYDGIGWPAALAG